MKVIVVVNACGGAVIPCGRSVHRLRRGLVNACGGSVIAYGEQVIVQFTPSRNRAGGAATISAEGRSPKSSRRHVHEIAASEARAFTLTPTISISEPPIGTWLRAGSDREQQAHDG